MSRLLPILMLAWSASAALPHEITYRTTPDIEPAFLYAMSLWNKALDGYFTSITPKDDGPTIVLGYGQIANANVVATTTSYPLVVTFSSSYSARYLPTACLHETGHAIGLEHSANPSAVMYYFLSFSKTSLSTDDIVAARILYGLPVEFSLVAKPRRKYSLACTIQVGASPWAKVESWDFGDGTTSEGSKVSQAPLHRFPARGTYTVVARLLNGLTATMDVTVGRPRPARR